MNPGVVLALLLLLVSACTPALEAPPVVAAPVVQAVPSRPLQLSSPQCVPAPEAVVAGHLASQFGEKPVDSKQVEGGRLVLYRNAQTGTWTILGFPGPNLSCIFAEGERRNDPGTLAQVTMPQRALGGPRERSA